MYPIPPNEHLVETKVCKHCGQSFPITDKDMEFYSMVSPTFGGKKYSIPTPTLCPDCRQQRRLSFRNERKLYKRKCDATGKDIVSIYSPDKPFKVYHQDYWWGDAWNPMSYGREFDFTRGFFEQFGELMRVVPLCATSNLGSENCEYAQMLFSKSCYYSFTGGWSEDILFSDWIINSADCIDCSRCSNISKSYTAIHSGENSSYLQYCFNCNNSHHLVFCSNLNNCEYCYMTSNKVNAKYLWKGEQLDKETFMKKWETLPELSKKEGAILWMSMIHENVRSCHNNIECETTLGNLNQHSKECTYCFEVNNSQNCKFLYDCGGGNCNDTMDGSYCKDASLGYEVLTHSGYNTLFSLFCLSHSDNSIFCFGSKPVDGIYLPNILALGS